MIQIINVLYVTFKCIFDFNDYEYIEINKFCFYEYE